MINQLLDLLVGERESYESFGKESGKLRYGRGDCKFFRQKLRNRDYQLFLEHLERCCIEKRHMDRSLV